jgi:hypothetical protein
VTTQEWLAANLAAAPPLSPEQITTLRQVFRPVIPHMKNAAPAMTTGAAPASTAPQDPSERTAR